MNRTFVIMFIDSLAAFPERKLHQGVCGHIDEIKVHIDYFHRTYAVMTITTQEK